MGIVLIYGKRYLILQFLGELKLNMKYENFQFDLGGLVMKKLE